MPNSKHGVAHVKDKCWMAIKMARNVLEKSIEASVRWGPQFVLKINKWEGKSKINES